MFGIENIVCYLYGKGNVFLPLSAFYEDKDGVVLCKGLADIRGDDFPRATGKRSPRQQILNSLQKRPNTSYLSSRPSSLPFPPTLNPVSVS